MKKRYRNTAFYVGVTGGFAFLVYCLIIAGSKLEDGGSVVSVASGNTPWADFVHSIASNLGHPLALLLAQIVTIILTARLLGWLCNRIGQPAVIGEIIAGIVLGPSLIGYYFPAFSEALFPVESLGNLQFISQIGLILFMFIIGMELDLKILKKKAGSFVSALYTIGLALLYVAAMIWIVKPFLARVGKLHSERDHLSKSIVAIFFLVLIMSSWATEVIGIHALFGAFLTGVIMPDNAKFRSSFIEKVEDVALVLLLPLYFVYTGLRTEIGLLDELSEDAGYLNQVRARAGLTDIPYSLENLQKERRYELAFEGVRWNDMRRWGMAYAKAALESQEGVKTYDFGVESSHSSAHPSGYSGRYEATKGFFPIPQTAIDKSEGLLQQVPGWDTADVIYEEYPF